MNHRKAGKALLHNYPALAHVVRSWPGTAALNNRAVPLGGAGGPVVEMTESGGVAAPLAAVGDPIRVLVVDDHALFRRGLEMVLEQEADIDVVGEAEDGAEAVEKAAATTPDIVLMDVRMPRRGGIDACTAIKDAVPSSKIIMLTISDEEADLYDAIKAGAMGYLLKEISIEEVASAIRAVHGGQSLISPSMASKLLNEFASMIKRGDERQQVPAPRLTDREMEVLRLVAKGLNNRDIAKQLFISENTVKNHIRNILEKLQLHSRMEAVVYAVREKLLEIT
jgi:two-component system NarL family response regulator